MEIAQQISETMTALSKLKGSVACVAIAQELRVSPKLSMERRSVQVNDLLQIEEVKQSAVARS